jgi:hypothetical protein
MQKKWPQSEPSIYHHENFIKSSAILLKTASFMKKVCESLSMENQ